MAEKNNWQVKIVRIALDILVVIIGVLLGGKFGICTIITVIISDSIDYTDRNEVMAAALFYQYLSEKDSEFLKNNNYTKEEVMSGFKQLLMQSGYTDLLCLVKAEE